MLGWQFFIIEPVLFGCVITAFPELLTLDILFFYIFEF